MMIPNKHQMIAKWKGLIGGTERIFRVTIADLPADVLANYNAGVYTILEERHTDALGVEAWHTQQMYKSGGNVDPVIECLIDTIGRPEWDTRPRTQLL
jgi:hypothetical protein